LAAVSDPPFGQNPIAGKKFPNGSGPGPLKEPDNNNSDFPVEKQ
jgi:hypothetical protein